VQWLFVDYDYYFSYGTLLYDQYYNNTWSDNVHCIPIGSLAINAKMLAESKTCIRNNDIIFFILPLKELNDLLSGLIWLANELKNMRILIKPKPIHVRNGTFNPSNLSLLTEAPDNLKFIVEDDTLALFKNLPYVLSSSGIGKLNGRKLTYELMIKSKYAISSTSTTIAEAIQLRCKAFVIDWYKDIKYVYYREFPNLCIDDFQEVAKRIISIEAGKERYDFDKFKELINLDITDPVLSMQKILDMIDWERPNNRSANQPQVELLT